MLISDFEKITPWSSIGGGAFFNLRFATMAVNQETEEHLIRWTLYIDTKDYAYITSNQLQQWSLTDISVRKSRYGEVVKTIPTAQTNYFDINTDINDKLVLAQGTFETDKTAKYFSFDAKLDIKNATVVNVDEETGTEINKVVRIEYLDDAVSPTHASSMSEEDVAPYFVSVNNFNDEENPFIKYYGARSSGLRAVELDVSLDGYTEHITRELYRGMDYRLHEYTLEPTEEERIGIREYMYNTVNKTAYIFLTGRYNYEEEKKPSYFYRYYVKRTISIINGNPVLTPYIEDKNATTLALTGDKSVIVRYHSNAYVNSNVEWQKEALSKSNSISVGAKSISASSGTINAPESNVFVFSATDSRGLNTVEEFIPPYIDYMKLSCYIEYEPVKADTGVLNFDIKGNCYNGSFGAVANNLGLIYRIKEENGAWSAWQTAQAATFNEHTYSTKVSISGLDYRKTYQIQAQATDRLNTIQSVIYTLTTVPVFDWSKTDFNFNVPVSFSDTANFNNGATFEGATFEGTVNLEDAVVSGLNIDTAQTTFDSNTMADYIIETGTEAMGSNGVWKWQKWKSGKAEAWGKRNFGNMGVSTAYYGSLYQSANFTQDLPSIFSQEPDVIDINIIKSNAGEAAGAFVLRGLATDASSSSTGSFAIAKKNSGTLSQVYLGFHIVGTWQSEE